MMNGVIMSKKELIKKLEYYKSEIVKVTILLKYLNNSYGKTLINLKSTKKSLHTTKNEISVLEDKLKDYESKIKKQREKLYNLILDTCLVSDQIKNIDESNLTLKKHNYESKN